MKTLIENINQVLAEWNPIGVGEFTAKDEYKGYIPLILKSIHDKQSLMNCLTDILVNNMGLDYNSSNKSHVENMEQVCKKIIHVYHMNKTLK